MRDMTKPPEKMLQLVDPKILEHITALGAHGTGSPDVKGDALLTILVAASQNKRQVDGEDFTQEEIDKLSDMVSTFLGTALFLTGVTACGGVFRLDEESKEPYVDSESFPQGGEGGACTLN